MSAVLRSSERCFLIKTVTNAFRSSRGEMGRRSWSLPGFGIGVIEKRLTVVYSMRWMSFCAILVHAMGRGVDLGG